MGTLPAGLAAYEASKKAGTSPVSAAPATSRTAAAQDKATTDLLAALDGWRQAHSKDQHFAQIDAKIKSLRDDIMGDADGDLKAGQKRQFPTQQTVDQHFAPKATKA